MADRIVGYARRNDELESGTSGQAALGAGPAGLPG